MRQEGNQSHNPIDVSMKMLIRGRPEVALSLAGLALPHQEIRFDDTSVISHELHADHVMILEKPRVAIYWEYQLSPKPEVVVRWFAKCAGLTFQLDMPVILIVIYLEKGDYATFHDRHEVILGNAKTKFEFTAIKLWEHAERIRSGELIELVPFLFLCENQPNEEIVKTELDLIHKADLSDEDQSELYQAVFRVAGSRLPKETINKLYRENKSMLKENFEYDVLSEILREEAIEEGMAKGMAEGKVKGMAEQKRLSTGKLLRARLGVIPTNVMSHLETASPEELDRIFDLALNIESYDELTLLS